MLFVLFGESTLIVWCELVIVFGLLLLLFVLSQNSLVAAAVVCVVVVCSQ